MAELPRTIGGLVSFLQKCRKEKDLASVKAVYAHVRKHGMETQTAVGNHLVPSLADCGALDEASQIFENLPYRNERSWTSLMSGYIDRNEPQRALKLYGKMQGDCAVAPSSFTLVAALKACAGLRDWSKGQQIHKDIVYTGYEKDAFVGNALVDMYAKCGSFADAVEASRTLQGRDVVTWTAFITGYVEHGRFQEAVNCLDAMHEDHVSPNVVTFVCILRAVAGTGSLGKGLEVHMQVVLAGFEGDRTVGNTLVGMYGKCGSLSCAQEVFNKLPFQDGVSWNALITGYAEHDFCEDVLKAYEQMQVGGVSPDAVTFNCALKASGSVRAVDFGQKMHTDVTAKGFHDHIVGNAVVDMYATCGMMDDAQETLLKLPSRDVVSWNALIVGYAEQASGEQAFRCLEKMQEDNVAPDSVSYISALKACSGKREALDRGLYLHKGLAFLGCEQNVIVGSALVDMYAKAGMLLDAQKIFDNLANRHVVVWSALVAGYAEHGSCSAALKCYSKMQADGISPDPGIFVSLLKAFKTTGALFLVHEVHIDIVQRGYEQDLLVCGILVDVYAKYGSLLEARKVFDVLPVRDVVSWSTMIRGYGMNHEGYIAFKCFESMQDEGVKVDNITFTCLLSACSRTQLIVKGQELFSAMRGEHGFSPNVEHYACLVDLLAKSGHLHEAEKYSEGMPCPPVLTTLLTACNFHGEASLGQKCFQQLTQ